MRVEDECFIREIVSCIIEMRIFWEDGYKEKIKKKKNYFI